jgi:hypothetical protein
MLDLGQAFWFHGDISGLTNRRTTIDTKSGLTLVRQFGWNPPILSEPDETRRLFRFLFHE